MGDDKLKMIAAELITGERFRPLRTLTVMNSANGGKRVHEDQLNHFCSNTLVCLAALVDVGAT